MNDQNWKSWALVIVIVLGGGLELIKRLPKGESVLPRDRAQEAQPYSVRKRVGGNAPTMLAPPTVIGAPRVAHRPVVLPSLTKEQMEKLAAAAPKTTEFDHNGDKAKKAEAKKKDEAEWEIVVDPKTGKRIKRKKKKVAKKEEEKKEEVAKAEEAKPEEEDSAGDKDDEDIDGAIGRAIATGKAPASNSKKADDAFASAEEWMRILLNRPNLAETKRFIDHRLKALVSAEVFYKVVNAMLSDSRAQMKQLGVLCLGSTPGTLSWQGLVNTVTKYPNSPAQTDAQKFIDGYQDIARLNFLQGIMQAGAGSQSTVLATKTLEASAQKYLGAQPQQNPPAGGQAAPVRNYSKSYQPFVLILRSLGKSGDQAIKAQAGSTLAVLEGLLQQNGSGQPQPGGQPQIVQPAQASN